MRLFIGIELPDLIRNELILLQQTIKALDLFTGRYVPKENLHVTVLFLGTVQVNELFTLNKKLESQSFPSFTLKLENVEIPSGSRHHVLWVKTHSDELVGLYDTLCTTLNITTTRPYSGHCTLARITQMPNKQALKEALKTIAIEPLSWKVESFTLFESQTLPEGPLYTKIKSFFFEK